MKELYMKSVSIIWNIFTQSEKWRESCFLLYNFYKRKRACFFQH